MLPSQSERLPRLCPLKVHEGPPTVSIGARNIDEAHAPQELCAIPLTAHRKRTGDTLPPSNVKAILHDSLCVCLKARLIPSALSAWWCPSIACMTANAASTRIWPMVESSVAFLSECPPFGRARFRLAMAEHSSRYAQRSRITPSRGGSLQEVIPCGALARTSRSICTKLVLSCCNRLSIRPLVFTECHLTFVDRLDQQATNVTLWPFHTRYRGTPPKILRHPLCCNASSWIARL